MSECKTIDLEPLAGRASSLRRQIYESLRLRLQRGEIAHDQRLIDIDIAQQLGVSRMPVREALLQLMNEGYLVGTTRGFVLPTLSDADISDIFEVRKLLEPRAAAHAARSLSPRGLQQLRRALEQARAAHRAHDVASLTQANMLFRQTWLDAVPNRRLASTISRFVDHVQLVRSGTLHDADTQRVVVEGLTRLHDAFTRRDAEAAAERMAEFIAKAEERFFHVRRKQQTPVRSRVRRTR